MTGLALCPDGFPARATNRDPALSVSAKPRSTRLCHLACAVAREDLAEACCYRSGIILRMHQHLCKLQLRLGVARSLLHEDKTRTRARRHAGIGTTRYQGLYHTC